MGEKRTTNRIETGCGWGNNQARYIPVIFALELNQEVSLPHFGRDGARAAAVVAVAAVAVAAAAAEP